MNMFPRDLPASWTGQDGFVPGEQVHGRQAAVRLHELQVDLWQALVEARLEGVNVPASMSWNWVRMLAALVTLGRQTL